MARLTIYDRRERALVRLADTLLLPIKLARRVWAPQRGFGPAHSAGAPRRILCLRLERIGDLLMTLPALAEVRALAPEAEIDLVVGNSAFGVDPAPGVAKRLWVRWRLDGGRTREDSWREDERVRLP